MVWLVLDVVSRTGEGSNILTTTVLLLYILCPPVRVFVAAFVTLFIARQALSRRIIAKNTCQRR